MGMKSRDDNSIIGTKKQINVTLLLNSCHSSSNYIFSYDIICIVCHIFLIKTANKINIVLMSLKQLQNTTCGVVCSYIMYPYITNKQRHQLHMNSTLSSWLFSLPFEPLELLEEGETSVEVSGLEVEFVVLPVLILYII